MYEVKLINNEEEIIINAVSTNKEAPRITGQCNFGINTIVSDYDYDNCSEYYVHNHPISHAKSYRDVLYDMFIRQS